MSKISPCGTLRCQLILQRCLAIHLSKPGRTLDDFWMYDSGYMIFQNFLAANSQCWWNAPLTAATHSLKYVGHVAPGLLLVTADPCALEILRGAYARSVLKPPATYVISSVGDIDDCFSTPTVQGQFTPLPEALCDIIMDSTAEGESATFEYLRTKLTLKFPHTATPAPEIIYDTLTQLMQDEKIYQTSKGFFILTPERRRTLARNMGKYGYQNFEEDHESLQSNRSMLLTNTEALHSLYGEITTKRDGDVTHQCIQTNLADVICGGNCNDKILYPRVSKQRSSSFTRHHSLRRGHSLKSVGSSRWLQRYASTKSLSKISAPTTVTDSSSSEYPSTDSSSPKKGSLFSRLLLFRKSSRTKHKQVEAYSGRSPNPEWFNTRYMSLKSIGTQTANEDIPIAHTLSNSTFYDGSELSQRSTTLPRRQRHHLSSDSTFLLSLRDCSPTRRRSNFYCSSSLPRSTQSIPAGGNHTARFSASTFMNSQRTVPPRFAYIDSPSYVCQEKSSSFRRQRDDKSINSTLSGPSSFESGKSSCNKYHNRSTLSGPSSLESGKNHCTAQNTESASVDNKVATYINVPSQCFERTNAVHSNPQPNLIPILNGSPRSARRFQTIRPQVIKYSKDKICTMSSLPQKVINQQSTTNQNNIFTEGTKLSSSTNASSNNAYLMLETITSTDNKNNCLSKNIFPAYSQEQSVRCFQNANTIKSENVLDVNNGKITNKNNMMPHKVSPKQNGIIVKYENKDKATNQLGKQKSTSNNDKCAVISTATSLINKCVEKVETCHLSDKKTKIDNKDFHTNIDPTNNNRNGSLHCEQSTNSKNWEYTNNIFEKNCQSNLAYQMEIVEKAVPQKHISLITGSVGNLQSYGKNSKYSNYDFNSLCHASKCAVQDTNLKLNSIQVVNSSDLQNLLKKNVVSSEPNLALMDRNCALVLDKSFKKKGLDRRLSLSKNKTNSWIAGEEFLNFPSLSDLSFNFTSLAAQKILQGVSLNDIVELNTPETAEVKNKENNKKASYCSTLA